MVNVKNKAEIDEHIGCFLNELHILKQMDHPNVIKLMEVYEDAKRYYVVTE